MNYIRIAEEVGKGLSIFCATCTHYWNGRHGQCGKTCGSPLVGMSFPEYQGIGGLAITDTTRFCFMCGAEPHPEGGVRVHGHVRVFAVCENHRKNLKDYFPHGGAAPGELAVYSGGSFVPVERVTLRKRTLLEEMAHQDLLLKEKYG